ncbi:MAG: hypothetical protein ABSA10_07130, partial [Anaerolineales bacterium]
PCLALHGPQKCQALVVGAGIKEGEVLFRPPLTLQVNRQEIRAANGESPVRKQMPNGPPS